ncbi:MAG TPA: PKD domain-containing protein, partial [Candidatus Paceibacterota bacterium]
NCTNTSTSVATVQTACGSLPTPSSGNCQSNANGYKCNSVNTNPRSTSHSYSSNSTVKVIVERGTASPAEARRAITMANGGPVTSNVRATEPNYCSSGPAVTVSWIYSDPEGQTQSAYQVQVDDTGSAWNIPMFDSGKISGSGISYFQNGLAFNTTYKSRVRTWDSLDLVGNWTEQSLCAGPGCLGGGNTWRTPRHAYPIPNFTWSPATPTANQQVQFTDQTQFFDGGNGNGRDWNWFFGDGGSSTNQNPGHTYTSSNIYNVTETATDRDDYSCSISRLVNVGQSIPVWIEVNPR